MRRGTMTDGVGVVGGGGGGGADTGTGKDTAGPQTREVEDRDVERGGGAQGRRGKGGGGRRGAEVTRKEGIVLGGGR